MSGFSTTSWSLVLSARDGARLAVAELLRRYWQPLYLHARREGRSVEDAQDLVQSYFLRFLERDFLSSVDADRGRFRSFLLASFRHFASNERDRAIARKRGGGVAHVDLDFEAAEAAYREYAPTALGPERLYDRRWAALIFERGIARLEAAHADPAAIARFRHLKPFLLFDGDDVGYSRVARELKLDESAVRVAVHRLRHRLGDALREELSEVVAADIDVEEELRAVLRILAER